jgi:hypothetical protein
MPQSRMKVAQQVEVLVEFPPPPMSFQGKCNGVDDVVDASNDDPDG